MIVTALFTKSDGEPATGLTLTDIGLYLYSRAKTDGTVSAVWSGENPSEEIGGGLYSKAYSSSDATTYDYFAYARYTGSTTLDSNYSLQESPSAHTTGEIADAVHDEVVESTLTFRKIIRILLAALAGKSSGGGTTTQAYRDYTDAKNRISATVDTSGNRTAITLDGD